MSSRVTLWFDVAHSPGLSPEQKDLAMRRLKSRIGKDGVLRLISQHTRSQAANRQLATERFLQLLRDALRQAPIRKKTPVSKAAKLLRPGEKKQHRLLKNSRSEGLPEYWSKYLW